MTNRSIWLRLTCNTAALYTAFLVRKATVLALAVMIARWEGPALFGNYCLALLIMEMAIRLVMMGTDVIIVRDIAARKPAADALMSHTFGWRLLAWLIAWPSSIAVSLWIDPGGPLPLACAIMGVGVVAHATADLYLSALQGQERMGTVAAVQAVANVVGLLLGILAITGGLGMAGLATAYAARSTTALVLSFLLRPSMTRGLRPRLNRQLLPALLRRTAPIGINRFLSAAYLATGLMILKRVHGETTVGQYAGAFKLFEVAASFGLLTLIAVFPTLNRLRQEAPDTLRTTVRGLVRFFGWVGVPAAALVAFFARPVLHIVLGREFGADPVALALLMAAVPFSLMFVLGERLAYTANDQRTVLAIRSAGVICNLVLVLLLAPSYGHLAPAMAIVATEFLMVALFYRRWVRYVPGLNFARTMTAPLLATACGLLTTVLWRAPSGVHAGLLYVTIVLCVGVLDLLRKRPGEQHP